MHRYSIRALVLVLAVATGFAAAPTPAQAAVVVKAVSTSSGYRWHPASVSVGKGAKVVWKNPTTVTHTVTAYTKNWSKKVTIKKGQSTSFTFKNAGTYKYYCTIHGQLVNGVCSGMCGKVVVG